jgi:hypothetical protein
MMIIGAMMIMVWEMPEPGALEAVALGGDGEVAGGAAEGDGGDEGALGAIVDVGGGEGAGFELVG